MSVPRTVMYRSLCERTFFVFFFTVNNIRGESQNVNLSLVADNTMLHRWKCWTWRTTWNLRKLQQLSMQFSSNSASVSLANEDDEQLPNTLKECGFEHATNLEHSKSGCLAAVCEKLQKTAVKECQREAMCPNNSDVLWKTNR